MFQVLFAIMNSSDMKLWHMPIMCTILEKRYFSRVNIYEWNRWFITNGIFNLEGNTTLLPKVIIKFTVPSGVYESFYGSTSSPT